MSIRVMSWVWEESPASGGALLLLLAIADHAADDGANAYPSVKTLMKKTRMSRSSVFRALRELVEYGWLEIESRGAGRETSHYRIVMEDFGGVNLTPLEVSERDPSGVRLTPHPSQDDTAGVSDRHGSGVSSDTPGVSLLTPRTVLEPSHEPLPTTYMPNGASGHADDGLFPPPPSAPKNVDPMARFREFYDAYPRHVAPGKAERAWEKAVKAGADPAILIESARLFAMERKFSDKKLIPYPATWLNDRRWEDEPDPDYGPPSIDVYAAHVVAPGSAIVPADPFGGDRHMARQAPRYGPSKPSTTDQRVAEGLRLTAYYEARGE